MSTITDTNVLAGTRFRLLPGFETTGGGRVYWGTDTTLVEVTRNHISSMFSPELPGNIHVRRLDGSNLPEGEDTQYVSAAFLAPIDDYDFSDIDVLVDREIIDLPMLDAYGTRLSSRSPEYKREAVREMVREMVRRHKAGTLPSFSSHAEAGLYALDVLMALPLTGDPIRGDYRSSSAVCEALGRWLDGRRSTFDAVQVKAQATSWPTRSFDGLGAADVWSKGDGTLCYAERINRNNPVVHSRSTGGWRVVSDAALVDYVRAMDGDPVTLIDRAGSFEYVRATSVGGSVEVLVREPSGREFAVSRNLVRAAFSTVEQQGASEPATREIDGVVWVRKDAVEADMAKAVEILHRRADEQGLCSVYDRTAREVDEATEFFKMGTRPRPRAVRGEVVIRVPFNINPGGTFTDDEQAKAVVETLVRNHVRSALDRPASGDVYVAAWRPTVDSFTVSEVSV